MTAHVRVDTLQLLDVPIVLTAVSSKSINVMNLGWWQSVAVEKRSVSLGIDIDSDPVRSRLIAFVDIRYNCTRSLQEEWNLVRRKNTHCLCAYTLERLQYLK